MGLSWPSPATQILCSGFWASISHFLETIWIILWDSALSFLNLVTPKKRTELDWPEFVPPKSTDSRSPCPALNALSNHAILPHDGRNITFNELGEAVRKYYNCSSTFTYFTGNYMARILLRNYKTDSLDLGDMCVHNGIEYDGSMTRYDVTVQPDQSKPDEGLVNDLISASKDGKTLTAADVSRVLTARFAHSKQTNGQFSLSTTHRFFAAGNAATLLLILGGNLEDIKPFLLEERIPQGWSAKFRSRMGLTMASFNAKTLRVLLGVDPSWEKAQKTPKAMT